MKRVMDHLIALVGNFLRQTLFYLRLVARRFTQDGCQHSAAALTYMTLFALVPLLTVLFTVLSLVPSFATLSTQVEDLILTYMLPSAGAELFGYLRDFSSQARLLSAPGIVLLVVTAYLMLVNIEKVFNRIWGAPARRSGIASFLVYWAVLSLGPLLVGAGLMINTYLISLEIINENQNIAGFIYALLEFLPWVMTALAFTLLYKAVPNRRVLFKNAVIGGVVAMLVFEAAKGLFGVIVSNTSFRSIYGAFSFVPLFLLWIYFSWMIILAGAEFVRATETFAAEIGGTYYPRSQACLMALCALYQAQRRGSSLSDGQITARGLHNDQWVELREAMLRHNLIALTQDGRYVLMRDLDRISVWDLLSLMGANILGQVEPLPSGVSDYHGWINRYNTVVDGLNHHARDELSMSVAELLRSEEANESDS